MDEEMKKQAEEASRKAAQINAQGQVGSAKTSETTPSESYKKAEDISSKAQVDAAEISGKAQANAAIIQSGISDNQHNLNDDGKILLETFRTLSKGGVTADERKKLAGIDDVLKDATIQLTKSGGAVISTSDGQSINVGASR